jgi:hypothetical protein
MPVGTGFGSRFGGGCAPVFFASSAAFPVGFGERFLIGPDFFRLNLRRRDFRRILDFQPDVTDHRAVLGPLLRVVLARQDVEAKRAERRIVRQAQNVGRAIGHGAIHAHFIFRDR